MPLPILNAIVMRCGCHNELLTIFFFIICLRVFVNYYAYANRIWNAQMYLQANVYIFTSVSMQRVQTLFKITCCN